MIRLRSVVGLCLLCALGFSAIAASSAAASKGTTGFTCKEKKEKGGSGFKRAHCTSADAVASEATYGHVAFAENTTTEVKGSNEKTAGETTEPTTVRLLTTIAGTPVEFQGTGWTGSGSMFNAKDPGTGEHYVQEEGSVTFTGVTVTKPAGKGCAVAGGSVKTNQLAVTSKGLGDALKFEPLEGTTFATLTIEGCSKEELNGSCAITGGLEGHPDGAVVSFSHAEITSQGGLKVRGQKAGLEGTVTISGRDKAAGDTEFTPLSVTTVETP